MPVPPEGQFGRRILHVLHELLRGHASWNAKESMRGVPILSAERCRREREMALKLLFNGLIAR